jgi:hypothetical protein
MDLQNIDAKHIEFFYKIYLAYDPKDVSLFGCSDKILSH